MIVVITVLTDLPVSTSRASDISAERSVMSEVNSDLAPCALAIHQAVGIWTLQEAHRLTAADRAPTPGLLGDDQTACSFASEGINDLADIQLPGTAAGKHLGDMVATTMLWTTSDALRAIEDVQTLMNSPKDPSVLHNLAKEETQLDEDRRVRHRPGEGGRPHAPDAPPAGRSARGHLAHELGLSPWSRRPSRPADPASHDEDMPSPPESGG